MNIGLSTSVMQRGRSGVARYVLALVRALLPSAGRHRFTLFMLEEDRPLLAFAEPAMELVTVSERFRPPGCDIFWHQTVLPRLAARHALDVLHVPSYRRMLWAAPCALVATIHDLAPFHVTGKYDRARMFYGRVVARRLARRQDRIIAVSQATARDIHRHFQVPWEKIDAIPNGLDHDRFHPGNAAVAKAWAMLRHGVARPFFLYVARLEHPAKNHVRLIEAFNGFKRQTGSDWQLVLGGGDWHGAEVIHAAIRRSPHAGDIHCLGFVPEAELPRWYHAAEALVFPSLFEGFGLPPLEAMACGCPVLCSTRGALGEVVGEAAALVDPEDTGELQRQLTRLAVDGAWRATLRAAGLTQAGGFDWAKTAEATLEIYARAAFGDKAGGLDPAKGAGAFGLSGLYSRVRAGGIRRILH
ncbi:glycosyltransferase family 1 protein [Opitutus sp. GAS368]|uniref:glycosyltransferase family 4 protein n=1 Tax=Opitutus sp. GAS368 TaxID=1882749 RepID=UPI000879ACCE|nr:glycosyltransferase family 1 protein [Opitutus sp. GAS368]SDS42564.1 Glycosyltransferase involved in cell wall bisynthesis [Opitutus sp. GAS368]